MSTTQPVPTAVPSKSFVLKVKPEGAEKWKILGYISLREDLSGGVATLLREDGTRLDKIAVFTQDKKPKPEAE